MTINEFKTVFNYLLDNNLKLAEQDESKLAICIEGKAGIGKTAIVKQVAEERGCGFTRINLSECEEVGDIIGSPIKEYAMFNPNQEEVWVAEKALNQFINQGYTMCTSCPPRTSYATPAWVPNDPNAEHILFLDDFSRASELFMQAIMSLLQFGEYISWKLPKKCHLVLSSNPDNGSYSVTGLDPAQKSRLLNFNLEFNVDDYASWMGIHNFKNEFINFALMYPEIFNRNDVINARSYSNFANACKGLKTMQGSDLETIHLISKAAFGDDYVSGLIDTFISNKLDQLISPEDILSKEWDVVKAKLIENIYVDGEPNAAISSTLTTRFTNYIKHYFEVSSDKNKTDKAVARILDICKESDGSIKDSKPLLTSDLLFRMIKDLNNTYHTRMAKLIQNPFIRQQLTKY